MAKRYNEKDLADIASGRGAFYRFLVSLFECLPNKGLLQKIREGTFETSLASWLSIKDRGFKKGLDMLSSYRTSIQGIADDDVLRELSVDRTRIIRGTGHPEMKPPYEGLYKKGARFGDSALGVKQFYRRAGLIPDEAVRDSVDYLLIELDFMGQLCLQEEALWRGEAIGGGEMAKALGTNRDLQEEFLNTHLGSWVGEFCSAVQRYASTDFYKGFTLILDAFIGMDKKWLKRRVIPK
ncbi:MAG: molecular chaperone TorD family protein [Syntrophorhabdaceae bacterium]|nr:molecular chaperone TorD family protein [Syntrophorhabdaceae bacterium]